MKKIIIIMVIGLVVAGLLFNTGCKKKTVFDITGVWVFTITLLGESYDEIYTFVGDERAGDVYWEDQNLGTYSVTDDFVNFTLEYFDIDDDYVVEVYRGYFDTRDQMSGSVTITIEGLPSVDGTWVAFR